MRSSLYTAGSCSKLILMITEGKYEGPHTNT